MTYGQNYSAVYNQTINPNNTQQISGNLAIAAAIERVKKDLSEHPLLIDKDNIAYEMDPLVKEETVSDLNYIGVPTYKIDTEYNFYTDYYENIVKQEQKVLESALPNLYIYGDDRNNEKPAYKNIITVQNKIEIDAKESENTTDYFNEYAIQYKTAIDNPSDQLSRFNSLAVQQKTIYLSKHLLNRLSEINRNQYLMPYTNKVSFETNEFSILMGILDQSKFTDEFCSLLINTQNNFKSTEFNLLTDVVKRTDDSLTIEQELTEEKLPALVFDNTQMMFEVIKRSVLKNTFKPPFTLGSEIEKKQNNQARRIVSQYGQQLTTVPQEVKNNQKSTLEKAIGLKVFSNRYNDFINNIKLKSSQIFKNSLLYTEVLMYELVKTEKDDVNGTKPIQSFYMPNIGDVEKVEFIDSQVKYGKEYNYILNSFNFSLSVEIDKSVLDKITQEEWIRILERVLQRYPSDKVYFNTIYTPPQVNTIINQQQPAPQQQTQNNKKGGKKKYVWDKIKGISKPENSPQTSETLDISYYTDHIYEVLIELGYDLLKYKPTIFKRKLFSEIMAVSDNPPPPPEVQVHGMMGIDNKLFFILNSSIAEFKAQPVIIQNSDLIVFSRNVLAQKLKNLQDIMMFDGDDRIDHFQIFRLEQHPYEYSEFKDHYVTSSTTFNCSKSTEFFVCDVLKTNHSTYLDNISPNKKYYYMFRSVDVHGNVSNPSPIYQIEMINSDGTIFPLINVVDFLKKEDKTPFKEVRRFLHIYPNMKQSLINEKDSQYFDEDGNIKETAELVKNKVVLGLTEEKMWNKKYRLKIRSKTTGKIIEIDFKFTHKTAPDEPNCK